MIFFLSASLMLSYKSNSRLLCTAADGDTQGGIRTGHLNLKIQKYSVDFPFWDTQRSTASNTRKTRDPYLVPPFIIKGWGGVNGRTSGSERGLQVHRTSWTRSDVDRQPAGSCRTGSGCP